MTITSRRFASRRGSPKYRLALDRRQGAGLIFAEKSLMTVSSRRVVSRRGSPKYRLALDRRQGAGLIFAEKSLMTLFGASGLMSTVKVSLRENSLLTSVILCLPAGSLMSLAGVC